MTGPKGSQPQSLIRHKPSFSSSVSSSQAPKSEGRQQLLPPKLPSALLPPLPPIAPVNVPHQAAVAGSAASRYANNRQQPAATTRSSAGPFKPHDPPPMRSKSLSDSGPAGGLSPRPQESPRPAAETPRRRLFRLNESLLRTTSDLN